MSNRYATPLHLELKKSRLLGLYVYSIFFIVVISIYLLPVAAIVKVLLAGISAITVVFVLKTQNKLRGLVWQEGNYWLLYYDNETKIASLTEDSFAISWLLILHFKTEEGGRCSQVVCYDSLHSQLFRQLKVRLKVEGLNNELHAKLSS